MNGSPSVLTSRGRNKATGLTAVDSTSFEGWCKEQSAERRAWVEACGFTGAAGSTCVFPDSKGARADVVIGVDPDDLIESGATVASKLPEGSYVLSTGLDEAQTKLFTLGFGLSAYRFDRYKDTTPPKAKLVWPEGLERQEIEAALDGMFLVRDLVNTPTNDMGPSHLAAVARSLGKRYGARVSVTVGEKLLEKNFPSIHAVGRASDNAPRLIDLKWGTKGPKVTLVGKGVCFDSGGLNIKPAAGMKIMKKDMGGAAHVLGVASMVMAMKLPVQLRVMVSAVENSISSNAFRPLDVLQTRKGLTVEIGNTDAEGRLVMSDALTEAGKVDLLLDYATLTGAARVALGTSLPAMFCNDDVIADQLLEAGLAESDPLWRLPLHEPYRKMLKSDVADLSNIGNSGYGGAITAALFLREFIEPTNSWVHIDVMAWNLTGSPAHPVGGEAMGIRAVYRLIQQLSAAAPKSKAKPKTKKKK
ncbi:MAG: leucyl aminopeptidase family protein [Myxococcota bacterium]|nr:leucyl aminopeptidase family protein [Myxococcota bacterium]